MLCSKCGNDVPSTDKFCSKCGNKIEIIEQNQTNQQSVVNPAQTQVTPVVNSLENVTNTPNIVEKPKNSKKLLFIILGGVVGLVVLILLIVLIVNLVKPDRAETLTNIEKNKNVSFKIDDKEFYIGDRVNKLRDNGYVYDTNFGQDIVYSDSISTRTFANEEDKDMFLGALYCSNKEDCKHSETVLVKANFYEDSDVIVNNYVKFDMSYEEIVEKYGKEDGRFYQDQELYVWTFDDKNEVGSPYMVLRFDEGGWFSWGGINEIRLGVFWYDGEYEHIVVPAESEVEE